jgi:hypothetical protein
MLRTRLWLASRVSVVIMALVVTRPLSLADETRAIAKGWDRDFLEDDPDLKSHPFFLAILSSANDRLTGYFAFRNTLVGPILLHGIRTPGDEFWPIVQLQITNDKNGEWTTIASSVDDRSLTTLRVGSQETVRMMVAMDPISRFVGKFRFGRVLLENGEAALFELNNLLPPKSAQDR